MAYRTMIVALSSIIMSSAALAMQAVPMQEGAAPPAPAYARYCLKVDPATGSRMETIRCETREAWADLGVNVDEEWAKWGIRILTSRPLNS